MLKARFYILLFSISFLIIGVWFSYFFYKKQIKLYSTIIRTELLNCTSQLEEKIDDFSARQKEIFQIKTENTNNINDYTFTKEEYLFLSEYSQLINKLYVIDTMGKALSFNYKYGDITVISEPYFNINDFPINDTTVIIDNKKYSIYHLQNSSGVRYYHIIDYNINNFVFAHFKNFLSSAEVRKWLISSDKNIYASENRSYIFDTEQQITSYFKANNNKLLKHSIIISGKRNVFFSALHQINILFENYTIVFSVDRQSLIYSLLNNFLLVSLLSVVIFSVLIVISFISTERRLHSKSLKEQSQAAFQKLFNELPIPVLLLNTDGLPQSGNTAAINYFRFDNSQGNSLDDFQSKALPCHNDNTIDKFKYCYEFSDGKKISFYRTDIAINLFDDTSFVAVIIDNTFIDKDREKDLAESKSKIDFLARISHEIRTPLNGIIGLSETILESDLKPKQKEDLQLVKLSADFLLTILNDVMDLSKINAGKMKLEEVCFDLFDEIDISLKLIQAKSTDKSVDLKKTISKDTPRKYIGDPFRLKQILNNIVGNALKFTVSGRVDINIDLIGIEDNYAYIRFLFEDTGIGINEDQISRLMKSYTQANTEMSRLYGGIGLGLAITKQLVEMMNGNLVISSPSSISTDSKYPGTSVSFILKLFLNNSDLKRDKLISYNIDQVIVKLISTNSVFHDKYKQLFSQVNINNISIIDSKTVLSEITTSNESKNKKCYILLIDESIHNNGLDTAILFKEHNLPDNVITIIISSLPDYKGMIIYRKLGIDLIYNEPVNYKDFISELSTLLPNKFEYPNDSKLEQELPIDLIILLAEDNIINQKVALSLLKSLGYNSVDVVNNGKEAFDIVKTKNYDLIFMDIVMPIMDGNEATRLIRKKGIKTPIIAMTANVISKDIAESLKTGMNAYITKPVTKDRLRKFIADWYSESKKTIS